VPARSPAARSRLFPPFPAPRLQLASEVDQLLGQAERQKRTKFRFYCSGRRSIENTAEIGLGSIEAGSGEPLGRPLARFRRAAAPRGCRKISLISGPVAYVYYEGEVGRRAAANLMTRDEARRIALNIAKLPELLKQ
jgi:hypothetical protein